MDRKIEITNSNIHDIYFEEGLINSEADGTNINLINNSISSYFSKYMKSNNKFFLFNI